MQVRGKVKDKRAAILDAALTLVTQYGLHGISMKMIAEKANIAAGTIYVHFKNKEEMLASVYEMITGEINQLVQARYTEQESFKDNFIRIWREVLVAYIDDKRVPDFINQYAFVVDNQRSDAERLLGPVYTLLEQAQKEGIVKAIPIAGLIALIHGPLTALVRMSRNTTLLSGEFDVQVYAEACWDAIRLNK
ncbi:MULTISPECIES: TetR/AcrR family transcriptional regulator [unclassified Carboxylicivirga]|uniref:TetR/AcrR family transcriptional regulator n=1 Tax=Carboxylicivirga TaxID=1628153 RepID=UPI003D32E406